MRPPFHCCRARSLSFSLEHTRRVIMREKDDALCSLFSSFFHQSMVDDGRGHWICAPDETIDAFYARAKGKENDVDVDEGNDVDEGDQFAAVPSSSSSSSTCREKEENNRNASRSIEKRVHAHVNQRPEEKTFRLKWSARIRLVKTRQRTVEVVSSPVLKEVGSDWALEKRNRVHLVVLAISTCSGA